MALLAYCIAVGITVALLCPGVWWGDSLHAYIEGVTGVYGGAQPVFFALLCSYTRTIHPGTLPIFIGCVLIYYYGLAAMVFTNIKALWTATFVFFLVAFWPVLFACIGVVQTETIQMSLLSLLVSQVLIFSNYQGRYKKLFFVALVANLVVFSLVRYDSLFVTILLSYWLGYTLFKNHSIRTFFSTGVILMLFFLSKVYMQDKVGIQPTSQTQMTNSLLVTDLAAISVEDNTNYLPSYCWQDYLPGNERTVEKIKYGYEQWEGAFYSYIYNVDPAVGLFKYETAEHGQELRYTWLKTVFSHPLLYVKFHFKSFLFFMRNDYFNMSFWSGLNDARKTQAKLTIEKTAAVDSFLVMHSDRFVYAGSDLYLQQDNTPITAEEKKDLLALVSTRRHNDIFWMQWFSSIPANEYVRPHYLAEQYVHPLFEFFKRRLHIFSYLGFYWLSLFGALLLFRLYFADRYIRFTFSILTIAGIVHLSSRFIFITDGVYRFGIISVLFLFLALILVIGRFVETQKAQNIHEID